MSRCAAAAIAVALSLVPGAIAAPRAAAAPPGHAERIEYRDPLSPPTRGPASALVTVEVFFVPGPSIPTHLLQLLRELADRHPARVRLIYRVLKGTTSVLGPSAALEAHAEGKFLELLDELSRLRSLPTKEALLDIAEKLGMDRERVAQSSQVERYSDLLEANRTRLERLHGGASVNTVLFNSRIVAPSPRDVLHAARGDEGFTQADLERNYAQAYDRAIDKLDRGFTVDQLTTAFDDEAMASAPIRVPSLRDEGERSDHPLATPPLALAGLPAYGAPGAGGVPIVVLCSPTDGNCANTLHSLAGELRIYPGLVRVVWAPWFDLGRDDAAELALLGDAALCAEAVGSSRGELSESPGWTWITEAYTVPRAPAKLRDRPVSTDALIDAIATRLGVDHRALSACRARIAGRTVGWIQAAQKSGVPHGHTATVAVVGGRIYEGLVDSKLIHRLVEAELAPGILGSLPHWPGQ